MRNLKFLRIFSVILSLMLIFNTRFVWALTPQSSTSNSEQAASYDSGNLQPLSLTTDGSSMGKFYSSYSSSGLYNITGINQLLDNSLQLRANCYGYAFRLFYALDDLVTKTDPDGTVYYKYYLQRPGEFANKTNSIYVEYELDAYTYVYNRSQLNSLYNAHFFKGDLTNSYRMNILDQLIRFDAATLGYTITEYTGSTIPSAQTYNNKRLVAMVVDDYIDEDGNKTADFHFYMQHSDNTWSHKTGHGNTYNTCLEHGTLLTNDTIMSHACEATYDTGEIKFYYITKDAISDYRHLDGTSNTSKYTTINNYDLTGDYLWAAKNIGTLPEDYLDGNIDYIGDVDYYVFESQSTGVQAITVTSPSTQPPIYAKIYNQSGDLLASGFTGNGTLRLSVNLTVSQKYYLSFSCPNQIDYVYNQLVYTFY